MSFADEKDGGRQRKAAAQVGGDTPRTMLKRKKNQPIPEVGNALRSAYQRTLDEDIPPEMLDLLGKLG
ncbi:MAG TPA: hypothetical protein VF702_00880 [Allosphingosinicella sp.]